MTGRYWRHWYGTVDLRWNLSFELTIGQFFSYGGCICALAGLYDTLGKSTLADYVSALEHGLGRHIEAVGNLLQRIEAASSWFKLL